MSVSVSLRSSLPACAPTTGAELYPLEGCTPYKPKHSIWHPARDFFCRSGLGQTARSDFTDFTCFVALQQTLNFKLKPSGESPGSMGVFTVGTFVGIIFSLVSVGDVAITALSGLVQCPRPPTLGHQRHAGLCLQRLGPC